MNIGKQKPDMARQAFLVFVVTAISLYAIGNLALALGTRWVGEAAPRLENTAQFIFPALLRPKPLERLVFLSVVSSVVPVLALAAFFVRFARLPLRDIRPPSSREKPAGVVGLLRMPEWLVIGFVMTFAVYAGGYYRWFGADLVDYKFTAPGSLDAVLYSIMRISQGGTCLVDVMPQYGCYREFFRPLWSFVTPSVKAVTTVFFFLYLAAIFAAIRFSTRIIRTPEILLFCGVTLIAFNSFYLFFDVDLQYNPLRTVFPCLALWVAPVWQNRASAVLAFALGAFAAMAICWNLDSGFPVLLALAILIAMSGCTGVSFFKSLLTRERLLHLSLYCFGTVTTLTLFFGYLSLKAGAPADPGLYIQFQRIFYISGLMMVPTPSLPHSWGLIAAVVLMALASLSVRVLKGRADPQCELIGFAGILAIGIFVYYTGRSLNPVLVLVSWLPLILAFSLVDRLTSGSMLGKTVMRLAGVGGAFLFVLAWVWFYGKGIEDRWAAQLGIFPHAAPLVEDAAFVARETGPNDKVAIFAPNQSALVLTAGRKLELSGPGITETLLWSEAGKTMTTLRDHGPEDLFLDPRIRSGEPYRAVYGLFEPQIRSAYITRDWEANGRLLHLARRRSATDRDGVSYDRPPQVSGGRRDFPLSVAATLTRPAFDLEMQIIAASQQARLAILVSSTEMDSEPFQGLVVYHQAQMGVDRWVLAMGNGTAWTVTPTFTIPAGRAVTVAISYAAPSLEIVVDGKTALHAPHFAVMSPTIDPLQIGDWIAHMFRADAPTDSPVDTNHGSPDYWKIQDRRFNGVVIGARLLP